MVFVSVLLLFLFLSLSSRTAVVESSHVTDAGSSILYSDLYLSTLRPHQKAT